MPFTPSHAIAAIGVHRYARVLPLSALVVGSMAPDFEYLIRLQPTSTVSHTLSGSVWFCVPMGLLGWWFWRSLILPALGKEFPCLQVRSPDPGWNAIGWVAVSIWVGAMTHIVWDSFTHPGGWMVQRHACLSEIVWDRPPIAVHKVLQHASSLLGALGIAWWIRGQSGGGLRNLFGKFHRSRRTLVWIASVFGAGCLGAWSNGTLRSAVSGGVSPGRCVVGFLDASLFATLGWALSIRWIHLRSRSSD